MHLLILGRQLLHPDKKRTLLASWRGTTALMHGMDGCKPSKMFSLPWLNRQARRCLAPFGEPCHLSLCLTHSSESALYRACEDAHPGCDEASRQRRPHMDAMNAQDPLQGPLLHEALPPGAPLLCRLEQEEHCAGQLGLPGLEQPGGCSSRRTMSGTHCVKACSICSGGRPHMTHSHTCLHGVLECSLVQQRPERSGHGKSNHQAQWCRHPCKHGRGRFRWP